jgi:hypothetical protein
LVDGATERIAYWRRLLCSRPARLAGTVGRLHLGFGKRDIYSNQIEVFFTDAAARENAPNWQNPLKQGKVAIVSRGDTVAIPLLLATDTTGNGAADYDTFYLCENAAVTPACAALRSDGS